MMNNGITTIAALALCAGFVDGAGAFSPPQFDWAAADPMSPAQGESVQHGHAGPFVGVHNDAMLVAGGANFPDGMPWNGGARRWWDDVFVLAEEDDLERRWFTGEVGTLPLAMGYGVSVSTDRGVFCIGGSDGEQSRAETFWMKWDRAERRVNFEAGPSLPVGLSFMAGALVGDTVYVVSGQETATNATGTNHVFALDLGALADDASTQWQTLPDLPGEPRVLPVVAGISDGPNAGLYVFSGRKVAPGARTELLTDSWYLDTATNEWEQLPDVKAGGGAPRCVMAGTSTNWGDDGIIVMGGDSGELFMELENLRLRAADIGGGEGEALTLAHNAILDNHPGFSRDVLYFDVNRRVWSLIGELPFKSPVTTSAVWWDDDLILPTGEIGPGVRTPEAWIGTPRATTDLTNQSDQPFYETVDLYVSDLRDGDPLIFRIPALALTARGTLLAACAERKGSHGDWADIDLTMRRSTDGGLTWDEPRHIAASPGETVDNATFIVDEENGIVHFVHQINYNRCYYLRSEDDGVTWSEPVDITDAFKPLLEPRGWEVLAPGPGHGIKLTSGRLVVPVWVAQGPRAHRPSVTSTIYSDDNGATWHAGDVIAENIEEAPNPSEMMAIELTDGRVMMSIRNESTSNRRLIAHSPDGATDWTTPQFHDELYEPICMASMARLTTAAEHDRDRILFSNPNSQDYTNVHLSWGARTRANVTVRMSYDEGGTWPISRVLEPDLSGYSDLASAPDGLIYCLYERDNLYEERGRFASKHISFARFNLAWLSRGQDVVRLSDDSE